MEKFFTDFDHYWNLIETNYNFAFTRYADGEVMLMKGMRVGKGTQAYTVDNWDSPSTLTLVGKELLLTLEHIEPNYVYAISSKTDNIDDYSFLRDKIKQTPENITFVNLWINANYSNMKQKLINCQREVIVICNEKGKVENFPFKVSKVITFPSDCINFWEKNSENYLNSLFQFFHNKRDELVFISCGPVSEIIIHNLFNMNPNNAYIDVGSSIDEFVHSRITRPFMNPTSSYAKHISRF